MHEKRRNEGNENKKRKYCEESEDEVKEENGDRSGTCR